ncbi:hypothetical protein B0J13DRAFT_540561 [Dactylonectria estremocensis]|uniref:DUF7892 domain-containing protein n=1 Tax=Dactylonectria estremocensis TaxID=1079267 RepID=A0A9P9FEV4_9HYPO|nr:hypothetical protein B0J13DRAFT_540561 [Dactylonectria estremocensis]
MPPLGTEDSGRPASAAMLTHTIQTDDAYSPNISTPTDADIVPTDDVGDNHITSCRNTATILDSSSNNKRKSPPESQHPGQSPYVKRVRIDEDGPGSSNVATGSAVDRSKQLPAEIWHHIFTFLPPRALNGLLLVNKLFHTCLNPSPPVGFPLCPSSSHTTLQPLKPDSIWQASRRSFWPRMPAPLKGKSELQMWRLTCSLSCQFCDSKGDLQRTAASDQWHRGPGAKGVSPVFPFFVSVCGGCLSSRSVKEIDVFLSSSIPSLLLPALPVVLITDQLHVIPPSVMQTRTLPSQSQVTKVFWSPHLEEIKSEFETVKLLGSAAAEEWVKGLEIRGKQALADASRWEKWDLAGGIHQMRTSLSSVFPTPSEPVNPSIVALAPSQPSFGHSSENANQSDRSTEHERQASDHNGILGLATRTDTNNIQLRPQGQQKRTKEEVAELKHIRRRQIEHLALDLDPPLHPNVLAHIPSFQAALQIITPLDKSAWELLRPRILAQREEAEVREKDNIARETKKNGIKPSKVTGEVTDQDWDDIQGPLRARISNFAEEIIHDGWNDGEKVKKKNSPQFAADVLLYVRKRFYAEVAKDAAAAVATGLEPVVDPPEGPWTQKLTLENMKWVYDFKIKHYTEQYRKELFLCNGCVGNAKFYGLEGVIQHYAAKHTSALSVGSVVVHWRAEWPEKPPFSPNARLPDIPRHSQPPGTSLPSSTSQPYLPYGGYHTSTSARYSTPGYGAPVIPQHFIPGPHTPFSPANMHDPRGPPTYGSPHPYAQDGGYSSYPPRPSYAAPTQPRDLPGGYGYANSVPHGFAYGSYPDPRAPYGNQAQGSPYGSRLDIMVKVVSEAWNKISSVNGLPASVKICVVVHCIAKTFQDEYGETAPLAMLIDGLSNHKEMRPVRNTNGLACKACSTDHTIADATNFSLPQLANHFNKHHIEDLASQGLPILDWRIEMVLLPDMSVLRGLKRILENNPPAHNLLVSTLPWAFEETQPGYPPERISWPRTVDQPLDEMSYEAGDQLRTRTGEYDVRPHKSEVLGGQVRHPTHTQSPVSHDIPNLRPASEVYTQTMGRVEQMQGRHLNVASGRDFPRSNRHQGPNAIHTEQTQRREVPAGNGRLSSPRGSHVPHVRDERNLDYRNIEPRRYASRAQPRERSRPSGRGWEEEPRGLKEPSERSPPDPVTTRPEDDGFGLLDALESHLEMAHEEVVYVNESGREIGRTTRPLEAHPIDGRFPPFSGRDPDTRRRFSPSRYDEYPRGDYYERDTRPKYVPQPHHHEPEPSRHRVYYDDLRPPPGPPMEAYELIEVRGPQGDYFIKRPLRSNAHDTYTNEGQHAHSDLRVHPSQRPVDDYVTTRPHGYVNTSQSSSLGPSRPNRRTECEEYDPRYPTTDSRETALRQVRR